MEEDLRESLERAFQAYGELLETMTSFKYLGRVLTAGDGNWPSVAGNLRKDMKSWMRMTRILSREGSDLKVLGVFFKAVVKAVFFFRAETWFLPPPYGSVPGKLPSQFCTKAHREAAKAEGWW